MFYKKILSFSTSECHNSVCYYFSECTSSGKLSYVFVCLEYDLEGYLGLSQKICSSDEVIRTGKGVCSGYSGLCVEMCR